jgi:hypothetical protein
MKHAAADSKARLKRKSGGMGEPFVMILKGDRLSATGCLPVECSDAQRIAIKRDMDFYFRHFRLGLTRFGNSAEDSDNPSSSLTGSAISPSPSKSPNALRTDA